MKQPDYLQSFYTLPVFIGFAILVLVMVFSLLSFLKTSFYDRTASITYATSDLCRLKTRADLALAYNVGYQIDQDFDMPAIKITAKPDILRQINQDFEKIYPNESGVVTQVSYSPKPQCHLPNVRYNAQNVNPRLASFIPDDVDYVSYAPKADKAVYCSYFFDGGFGRPIGSKCYFVQIQKDILGKEELIRDDISDLERLNLTNASTNFLSKPNTYSVVDEWEDEPNPTQIYGIAFGTRWDGNRWGIGRYY